MKINCYTCKTDTLRPVALDGGLEALRCQTCKGIHIYLAAYRDWLDKQTLKSSQVVTTTPTETTTDFDFSEVENTEGALICQGCGKYTTKYLIDNEFENIINACHVCDDIWLDRGEWQLLKYLNKHNKLTKVLSDRWQARLKAEQRENDFKLLYQDKLGEDFDQTEAFAQWLVSKPNKGEILHYLREREL